MLKIILFLIYYCFVNTLCMTISSMDYIILIEILKKLVIFRSIYLYNFWEINKKIT